LKPRIYLRRMISETMLLPPEVGAKYTRFLLPWRTYLFWA